MAVLKKTIKISLLLSNLLKHPVEYKNTNKKFYFNFEFTKVAISFFLEELFLIYGFSVQPVFCISLCGHIIFAVVGNTISF